MSNLTSDITKCLVPAGGDKLEVNFGMYHKRVDSFFKLVQKNMTFLKNEGNITRLEIATSVNPSNIELDVVNGLINCLKLCIHDFKVYSAGDIADIAEFFAQALRFRAFVAADISGDKSLHVTPSDMVIYRVIPEVNAYIRNFYSGRKSAGDRDIYGKKFGSKFGRPVLEDLSECLPNILRKFGIENIDFLWDRFLKEKIGVFLSDRFSHFGRGIFLRPEIRNKLVCQYCLRIFSDDETDTSAHPCIEKSDINMGTSSKLNLLSPTSPLIRAKVLAKFNLLTVKQKEFIEDVMTSYDPISNFNVTLIGIAGSGKSFTIDVLIHKVLDFYKGQAKVAVLSLTKSASSALNGSTIHSYFGLSHKEEEDFNMISCDEFLTTFSQLCAQNRDSQAWIQRVRDPVAALETLVIDECSMISSYGLGNIDLMLRILRERNQPFGGVRMILVGDCLQMCPTFKGELPLVRFFFQSPSFTNDESNYMVYYMNESIRQKDQEFVELLNKVRIGDINEEDLKAVNKWGSNVPHDAVAIVHSGERKYSEKDKAAHPSKYNEHNSRVRYNYLRRFDSTDTSDNRELSDTHFLANDNFVICAENEEVKEINLAFDQATVGSSAKSYRFKAYDCYRNSDGVTSDVQDWNSRDLQSINRLVENGTKLPTELYLYEGKVVKFTKNNIGPYIANNMLGKVISINYSSDDISEISIRPLCNHHNLIAPEVRILPYEEEFKIPFENVTVRRRQYPLLPATANTLYTAQGFTCRREQNVVVCNHRFKHAGSAYTALSRAQVHQQVFTLFPLMIGDIIIDPIAKEFDNYHRQQFKSKVQYFYDQSSGIRWLKGSDGNNF